MTVPPDPEMRSDQNLPDPLNAPHHKFVQIAATGQQCGGGTTLYALDSSGQVWEYGRYGWTRLAQERYA